MPPDGPRWPQRGPNMPQDGPRWPMPLKMAQNGPQRGLMLAPTWPQPVQSWPQRGQTYPQHGPTLPTCCPNIALTLPHMAPTRPCHPCILRVLWLLNWKSLCLAATWSKLEQHGPACPQTLYYAYAMCRPLPHRYFYSVFWRLAFANRLPHHRPWPHMARSWQHAPRKAPTWPQSQHGLNIGATWCKMAAEPSAWSILPSSLFLLENHVFYSVFWHQHGPNLSP